MHRLMAVTLVVLAGAPMLRAQGLSYDIRTSATMVDPRTKALTTRDFMTAHGQYARGMSRVDITQSLAPSGPMGAGTYLISDAAKGTTINVDPARREYVVLNAAELARTAADLQQSLGSSVTMQLSGVSVALADLGAGEPIEGYATWKYRMTESFTLAMTVMGHASTSTTRTSTDFWVAPQLDEVMDPRSRPTGAAVQGPMAELSRQVAAAYAGVRKGLMLKRISTSESGTAGRPRSMTMTMTVSNLQRAAISAAQFVVPAGYTRVEALAAVMGPMQDSIAAHQTRGSAGHGGDSAEVRVAGGGSAAAATMDSAAAGAKQGALEGAKEGGHDKAKKIIGRLFGH